MWISTVKVNIVYKVNAIAKFVLVFIIKSTKSRCKISLQ